MFNGRFGLQKFSLGSDQLSIPVSMGNTIKLNCVAGFGVNLLVGAKFTDEFNNKSRLTLAFWVQLDLREELTAKASCDLAINLGAMQLQEAVNNRANVVCDVALPVSFVDRLDGKVASGCNFHGNLAGLLQMGNRSATVTNMRTRETFSEVLQCAVDATTLTKEIAILNVTIPPGGKLVIDSDSYSVYLNDENVLHLHSGEWIFLDRDLLRLELGSGTGGNLAGQLIYTGRYL